MTSTAMDALKDRLVAIYGAGKDGATVFAVLKGYNETEEWYADQNTGEIVLRVPRAKYDIKLYKKKEKTQ